MPFRESPYDLRCEWATSGLQSVARDADVIIIVDVLSFSTAVDIAVSNGADVYPYPSKDDSAREFAEGKHAILAAPKRMLDVPSLSPASLRTMPHGSALVLPSPNGSALAFDAPGTPTFTACLRNAPQVARCAVLRGRRIAVIPAGERWPDNSLRPCIEDLLGAGAVLAALPGRRSPEAELAIAAFQSSRDRLPELISHCSSGRELIEAGFPYDVELAAEYDVSSTAPLLVEGHFQDDRSTADRYRRTPTSSR